MSEQDDLMSFLYACPVGLIEFDQQGTISLINPHAMNLLLPISPVMEAGNLFDLVSRYLPDLGSDLEGFSARHGTVNNGYRMEIELGGRARAQVLSLSVKVLGPNRYMATLSEITRQVEQENRLAQAEAANKAKTDFMGVLSHELRTPLTVILGIARLASNAGQLKSSKSLMAALRAGDTPSDDMIRMLDDISAQLSMMMQRTVTSGDHLMHLINEMLDFARIESGNLSIECETCEIGEILDPILHQLAPLAEQKGLTVDVTQEATSVYADRARTRQILFNLIGNAIKFTDRGFVRVLITARGDGIVFEVHDSGTGILEAEFENIFDPFYQIDSTAVRRAGGTGMGLSISRNLAEMQGGSLVVSSTFGQGSQFTLTVPATQAVGGAVVYKVH